MPTPLLSNPEGSPISVALVCMPWSVATRPSISLGILQSVLEQAGKSASTFSYHLAFAEHLSCATRGGESPITLDHYERVANGLTAVGAGDWVFAVPPYRERDESVEAEYFAVASLSDPDRELLRRIRDLVPSFLDACVDDLLASGASIVAFTTTFCQNVPALALAQRLKQRRPALHIVFGGSNCEAAMGAALHRSHPWVDVVVRGEGEQTFPRLVDDLVTHGRASPLPGLCFWEAGRQVVIPEASPSVPMHAVPVPSYDEYFARVETSAIAEDVRPRLCIPYESARGCWWGQKHHCTFCGLNGATMRFRSKPAAQVLGDIQALARKHQLLDFYFVDNILDMEYLETLLPSLKEAGHDLILFFETKANLRASQIRRLREAGVRSIQPGIESLSAGTLRLIRKGVTPVQNVRLLKWCAAFDINVQWNLIYGFPGESPGDHDAVARVLPALSHLYPPHLVKLRIDRFSPYHSRPDEFGLRITGPQPFYRFLYAADPAALNDLAYFFDAEYLDGTDPDAHVHALRAQVKTWNEQTNQSYRRLRCRLGPGFLTIDDNRPAFGRSRYILEGLESEIYLACDAGTTIAGIQAVLSSRNLPEVSADEIGEFLGAMERSGLIFRDGNQFLSLAIPDDPDHYFRRCTLADTGQRAPSALIALGRSN